MVTILYLVNISVGIGRSSPCIALAVFLLFFPFNDPISGPKISSAVIILFDDNGILGNRLMLSI
jgi:hypothetical protein